jgi:hypothetical protein
LYALAVQPHFGDNQQADRCYRLNDTVIVIFIARSGLADIRVRRVWHWSAFFPYSGDHD